LNPKYLLISLVVAVISIILFYFALTSIPYNPLKASNSLQIQDYAFIIIVSILFAVSVALQLYSFDIVKKISKRGVVGGLSAFITGLIAGVTGVATCTACAVFLISFIGLPGMLLLSEYSIEIKAATILLLLASIYFTERKIDSGCEACSVNFNVKS
jgi:uncharacterized membrane protein YwzB